MSTCKLDDGWGGRGSNTLNFATRVPFFCTVSNGSEWSKSTTVIELNLFGTLVSCYFLSSKFLTMPFQPAPSKWTVGLPKNTAVRWTTTTVFQRYSSATSKKKTTCLQCLRYVSFAAVFDDMICLSCCVLCCIFSWWWLLLAMVWTWAGRRRSWAICERKVSLLSIKSRQRLLGAIFSALQQVAFFLPYTPPPPNWLTTKCIGARLLWWADESRGIGPIAVKQGSLRGQGLGKKLMEKIIEKAKQEGTKRITLIQVWLLALPPTLFIR